MPATDGLGRMTVVWEDPNNLNYETDYGYNTLDELTSVTQKGDKSGNRSRTFYYDLLSRLTSSINPESGTIGYAYSNSASGACAGSVSVICTKTAPAPNALAPSTATVTTTYSYDNLNRLTKKTYSDGTTPTVSFGYDTDTSTLTCSNTPALTDSYPTGERTAMCDGSGATSWAHEKMGRVLTEERLINGSTAITNSVGYTYNLDGSLAAITYPSNRLITYTPNNNSNGYTAGRPVSAVDTANSINYVTAATYAPQGALSSFTNGGAISGALTYNTRLQPLQMYYTSGTISPSTLSQLQGSTCPTTAANIMSTLYNFSLGSNDNANVQSITNCRNTNRSQNFLYDSLNRISQAYSTGTNWGETFGPVATSPGTQPTSHGIDAWGNLTNRSGVTGKTNYEGLNCKANTNNQLTACSLTYDIAGNMVSNGSASYTYDAENRITTTASYTYVYDGNGERVKKASGTTGTLYWKGTSSDALAESDLSGTMQEEYIFFDGQRVARREVNGGAVHYYFSDHLGSHGVVMNAAGTSCEQDIDYYPFGGVQQDYCGTVAQNYKFTGKERDSESGLDNFTARYFGSSLGRFMSPDPLAGHVSDPQTLNRYAYVRNNPLNLTDPTGLDFNLTCSKNNGTTCQGGYLYYKDKNGDYQKTVIKSDEKGNLTDQSSNRYSASVTGAGVSFTQAGSNQSSLGTFINGSNPTNLQATNMPGFSFTFTYSNPAGHVTAGGSFTYSGNPIDAEAALGRAGFQHYKSDNDDILHPSSFAYQAVDFRSPGDPGTGANSGHFTVQVPWGLGSPFQLANGPTQGDVHLGEHNNNTPGGYWPHVWEVVNTFRDKVGLY